MTLLSLANEPLSRSRWTELASKANVRVAGNLISSAQMRTVCDELVAQGALFETQISAQRVVYELPVQGVLTYLEEAAVHGRLEELCAVVHHANRFLPEEPWRSYGDAPGFGTEVRVAVILGDAARARRSIRAIERWGEVGLWLLRVLGIEPPMRYLEHLGEYGPEYLGELVRGTSDFLGDLDPELVKIAAAEPAHRLSLARYLSATGRSSEAAALDLPKGGAEAVALLEAFWKGDRRGAMEAGRAAVAKISKRRKYRQLGGLEGLCYALARVGVAHEAPAEWEALGQSVEQAKAAKAGFPYAYSALGVFHRAAQTGVEPGPGQLENACGFYDGSLSEADWMTALTVGLVHAWLHKKSDRVRNIVAYWAKQAGARGFDQVALEFEAVANVLDGREVPPSTLAGAYHEREPWDVALTTLEGLVVPTEKAPGTKSKVDEHIVWEVALGAHAVSVSPRVINGPRAKRGKPVSLTKMLEGKVDCLSDQDRRVLGTVQYVDTSSWGRSRKKQPVLESRALLGLVDHPHVIRAGGAELRVTKGEPGLRVESEGDELRLTIQPPGLFGQELVYEERSHGHVVVYERTPELERVARALNASTLRLPGRARERLGKVLGALGSTLRVSASADIEIAGEDQPTDSRVAVILHWNGTTLSVRYRVAPLGLEGPHLRPGEGGATVAATIDGRALRTRRDMTTEQKNVEALLDTCPMLAGLSDGPEHEASAPDLHTAMEVLLELDALGDSITLAWPRGKRLPTPSVHGMSDARIRVREGGEWLTVDVQLPVDEDTVLGFRDLLDRRRGRFVKLDDARFVALTENLRRRLDALEGLGKVQKKGLVASPVVLPLIEELAGDAEMKLDPAAGARLERVKRAAELRPRVPRRFEAELRDYQREGFTWMARLAEAGLGACLADDMGLGKTVQTLALLVSRAKNGPALVVAPTSVASNWIDEAKRFAPTLRAVSLATSDREAVVEKLGPRDLLVCSYGLLVTESERLSGVSFDTVVFDEAHMLKNARTKRAKGAAELSANFRLSLTGTPIENHLGELWSLMQVTVPGLLGSEKHFEKRFANPIGTGDRERARQLRALLRPFLLRRTKAQVLDELPPRTEVTVRVAPHAEEAAFYEALRRRALEAVEDASAGNKGRLQILAQITRLRQAAVDPRLLEEDGPAGAKVDALIERLLALRAEGHRALVFSQFLGGMERVRAALDEVEIPYLSLDGSTSAKERSRLIAAFQDGEADVFVMSLKAGGVGVNLTGADYVIHLDPWWNPAVEDQATGRSHRIGQERPVTVYRLVTEGTIEEKILALHRDKRELAEDLLGKMDQAKKLDLTELQALL